MSRKDKRKEVKKLKRKQWRQQQAALGIQEKNDDGENPAGLDDADALLQQQQAEAEALAKEQAEHTEQERLWLLREEEARQERLRKQEAEAERKLRQEWTNKQLEEAEELEEGWEYVDDGPAEIIWKGNEIIVTKPKKKVRKGSDKDIQVLEDKNRPTSNPLPPQSTVFSSYQLNVQDVVEKPENFGTEQDKRNCPFYIKTGVCRFGVRCRRLHPMFNDKACTLLMRSMYSGAGLALEHIESLETTDEEVAQVFEIFYNDVHSEFLQFGEIVNFKVCRNSSPHLRGNVYVHFLSEESAIAAYNAINGRFFAKKQISCEFVGVTKWRAAICGEYMRTKHKGCSRGTACNFLHCFENPHGEYEWADWDKPPPRYWKAKMAKVSGYPNDSDEASDGDCSRGRGYGEISYSDNQRNRDVRESRYDDRRRDRDVTVSGHNRHRRRGNDERESRYVDDQRVDRSMRDSTDDVDDRRFDRDTRELTYDDNQRRNRHWREYTSDDDDYYDRDISDNNLSSHNHDSTHKRHRSSRHHSSHRSESRDSRRTQLSQSREAHHFSNEDLEDRTSKWQRDGHEQKTLSPKEHKQPKQLVAFISDDEVGSQGDPISIERKVEEKVHKHRHRHSDRDQKSRFDDEHQHRHKQKSAERRSHHLRKVKDSDHQVERTSATDSIDTDGSILSEASHSCKQLKNCPDVEITANGEKFWPETDSNQSTSFSVSLTLIADDVQQSTAQWQTWRLSKSKRAKKARKEGLVKEAG